MEQAFCLVEVDCLAHVGGDCPVVFAGLFNTVHLNGEQDWDVASVEFAGQVDGLGSSPAMAEDDDAGGAFLGFAQVAIVAGIERLEDSTKGVVCVVVGEGNGEDGGGIAAIEIAREPGFGVREVVCMDAPAHEADNEQGLAQEGRSDGMCFGHRGGAREQGNVGNGGQGGAVFGGEVSGIQQGKRRNRKQRRPKGPVSFSNGCRGISDDVVHVATAGSRSSCIDADQRYPVPIAALRLE